MEERKRKAKQTTPTTTQKNPKNNRGKNETSKGLVKLLWSSNMTGTSETSVGIRREDLKENSAMEAKCTPFLT